jgi:asparagine synthase (glutamine-hydrolysing)
MCRIAGVFSATLPPEEIAALVAEMCAVQEHGGPDDDGMYKDHGGQLVLGHRRLSILDITQSGHQPMVSSSGRCVITYNGELYNYQELRNELKMLGHHFSTNSDTEVILASYEEWGTASFEKFSGMFAFAIWEKEKKELVLARDAAGIKPLYIAATDEGFAFASEVRALKKVPYLHTANKNWQVYLMAYGHLPEPVTTLQHAKPLTKGYYLKYETLSGKVTTNAFARYTYLETISDRSQAMQLIKDKLEASVKRHLISDAPLGVFLSGGLDSSILALLANKHQQVLNTISIYFEDHRYSEKKYQDILQEKLSCNHQQFLLKENHFHALLPSVIEAMDLPCCDGINTWFISKYAKESGLKAVLSGIGGDELFGGYPSFKRVKTTLLLQNIPNKILRTSHFSTSKKFRRLCYLSIHGQVGKYLFLRGQFIPADIAAFLDMEEQQVWSILEEQPEVHYIDHLSPANQASWLETNMYMQNQLLRDADVMGMAHGVEIRVPYLDKDFMQMAMKIENNLKYKGEHEKQLLIDCFKDILPPVIWNREKMGFSFPFKEWLSADIYKRGADGRELEPYHSKFKNNQMHWSQYFTMLLLHTYGK